jgi:hypothetical protein
MRQEGTAPQAFTGKGPRLNEANRRVTHPAFPRQRTVMGARRPGPGPTATRAVTAGFCQHGRRAAFRVTARRRPSSTGGEACRTPGVRQSRPLCPRISDEALRSTVNVRQAYCPQHPQAGTPSGWSASPRSSA